MILGFEKDPGGKNCPDGTIVTTLDKCKDASVVLGLTYIDNRHSLNFPAGCHWTGTESYFNAVVEPSQTSSQNFGTWGGVCDKGNILASLYKGKYYTVIKSMFLICICII